MVEKEIIAAVKPMYKNAEVLLAELEWITLVAETRIKLYTGQASERAEINECLPPELSENNSVYAEFINFYQLSWQERIVLLLSLLPHIAPQLLGSTFRNTSKENDISAELCGVKNNSFSGFLPSGETALFLLAGTNLSLRFNYQQLFNADHIF